MCVGLQMSSIKIVDADEVRAYLSSLNTMDVTWLGNRLGDQTAKLLRENQQPSEALLTVLALINEQILDRFELIHIIQIAVPKAMAKIKRK